MKFREVPLTGLISVVLGPALGGQTMTKHSRYSEYILRSDINIAARTTHCVFVYADRRQPQPRLGSRLWWLEARQTNTNYLLDENTHHQQHTPSHHAHPQHCRPLHQVSRTWSRGGMQGKVKYAECHKRTFSHFIVLIKFKSNTAHFLAASPPPCPLRAEAEGLPSFLSSSRTLWTCIMTRWGRPKHTVSCQPLSLRTKYKFHFFVVRRRNIVNRICQKRKHINPFHS